MSTKGVSKWSRARRSPFRRPCILQKACILHEAPPPLDARRRPPDAVSLNNLTRGTTDAALRRLRLSQSSARDYGIARFLCFFLRFTSTPAKKERKSYNATVALRRRALDCMNNSLAREDGATGRSDLWLESVARKTLPPV